MTRTDVKRALSASLAALLTMAACVGLVAATAKADTLVGKPVTLAQASIDPSFIGVLEPGQREAPFQCGHSPWTDVSAYTLRGGALSGSVYDDAVPFPSVVWRDRTHRAVTFDGVYWRNHTSKRVLIAGWCE